jgi:hypothetical protein
VKRSVVIALAKVDEALDEVLYRPAVVKAFCWVPRWWLCDLAKLSMRFDDRWRTGYWDDTGIPPGEPCEACGRRASIHVYGDVDPDEEPVHDYLESRPVRVCGWCHLDGPLFSEEDVQRELARARADSIAWRWRWRSGSSRSDRPVDAITGRFRQRTRLRRRLPLFLVQRGVAAKGRSDCGNHEWYKASDDEDHCYHCRVGVRRPSQIPQRS